MMMRQQDFKEERANKVMGGVMEIIIAEMII